MGLIDKVNVEVNGSGNLLSTLSTYTTKVLKPNIIDGKNILTQAMISSKNTKYVIKYDYELVENITVPKNCVLEFDGGTLSNGTIIGQDTYINDVGGLGVETLFGEGITREGTWRMNEGGGGTVTVDSELSDSSVNPVQNKVIKQALDNKQPILRSGENIKTINGQSVVGSGNIKIDSGGGSVEQIQSDWAQDDSTKKDFIKNKPNIPQLPEIDYKPTAGSDNLVTSGGVYAAINDIANVEEGSGVTTVHWDTYYWSDVFDLNNGDTITVTPKHVTENQVVWSDNYREEHIIGGGFTYKATTDNEKVYVGFTGRDEYDYVIARKDSIVNSAVSYKMEQNLSSTQKAMARQNIGVKDADDHLDATSVNPVQNKVAAEAISEYSERARASANSYTDRQLFDIDNKISESEAGTDEKLEAVKNTYLNHATYVDNEELKDVAGQTIKPVTSFKNVKDEHGVSLDDTINSIKDTKINKNDVYTIEQVDNLVSRTPQNDVVVVTELPSESVPDTSIYNNKLYRLKGTNNYSEWGWDGAHFQKLAEYNHGIDESPVEDSDNLISSKGIAKIIKQENSKKDYIFADKTGTVYGYISNNKLIWIDGLEAKIIKTDDIELNDGSIVRSIVDNNKVLYGVVDETGAFVSFVNNDIAYTHGMDVDSMVSNGNTGGTSLDVYDRNIDKDDILYNICRYGNSERKLQLLVVTDTHRNTIALDNAAIAASKFKSVDALIHLGDVCTYWPRTYDKLGDKLSRIFKVTKPVYFVVGNHDKGSGSRAIEGCLSDREIYNMGILPMIKKGRLVAGEYQENKLYYFHDFTERKVKLIVLDPYDDQCFAPNDSTRDYSRFIETGTPENHKHWIPVPYNPEYPKLAINHTYHNGDMVNVDGFTEFSFQVTNDDYINEGVVTAGDNGGFKLNYLYRSLVHESNEELPCYKSIRDNIWYGEEQLNWFVNQLKDAATKGYNIIIAQHDVFSPNTEIDYENDFTQYNSPALGRYNNRFDNNPNADSDIIAKIANAFITSGSLNNIQMAPKSGNDPRNKEGDNYTLYDGCNEMPQFIFSCDFSTVTPTHCTFICGHYHRDVSFKHSEYNLTGVAIASGVVENGYNHDLFRDDTDSKTMDILTAITVYDEKIHLCRIGNSKALKIYDSDVRLISKDNIWINN